jgi:hypothetical protein
MVKQQLQTCRDKTVSWTFEYSSCNENVTFLTVLSKKNPFSWASTMLNPVSEALLGVCKVYDINENTLSPQN